MSERLKTLRKTMNMSQEAFGEKLGVGKTAISKLEKGENNLTDQMLILICREYNVSKDWLLNGVGEMFVTKTPNQELSELMGDLMFDESDTFMKRLVAELLKLDEEEASFVEKFFYKLFPDRNPGGSSNER